MNKLTFDSRLPTILSSLPRSSYGINDRKSVIPRVQSWAVLSDRTANPTSSSCSEPDIGDDDDVVLVMVEKVFLLSQVEVVNRVYVNTKYE